MTKCHVNEIQYIFNSDKGILELQYKTIIAHSTKTQFLFTQR